MSYQKKLYRIAIVLIGAMLLLLTQSAGFNQTAVAQSQDTRFGAVESFWAPAEAADLGVGWERILFYWNEIQPTGPEDWNTLHVLEEWLVEANANGRQVVGLLKNTPLWATDDTSAAGVPRGLYLPIDDPNNLWANYVRRTVSYYGARGVNNWIIWNEPDIAADVYGHEFAGSMDDYVQLLKVAYLVSKETNPNAKIHLGGLTYWHDPSYLGRLMQRIAAEPDAATNNYYFDVVSLHIYFRPETVSSIVGNGFFAQQQAGISPLKQVWINETNARPSMDPEWPVEVQSFPVDLEQQAWYIPQAFALGFYAGAAKISVYKLIDVNLPPGGESWGLVRPHDFSPRPAYFSYKTTIDYLAGFEYPIGRRLSDNHYWFTFDRPQGVTHLMWARNQTAVTLRVPALAESAELVQSTGEVTIITPEDGFYEVQLDGARCYGECLMGGPPLFLFEAGVRSGDEPAPPPVIEPTAISTPDETAMPTATETPEETATPTLSPTPEATNTAVPTNTPQPTTTPTETPEPTDTPIPPTATMEPTAASTEVTVVVETAVSPNGSTLEPPPSRQIFQTIGGYFFFGGALILTIALLIVFRGQPRK